MKVKQGKSVNWLFLEIPLRITITMESSQRDFPIDMVVERCIFNNNQITPSPCITVIPKTGMGLPETGVNLYRVRRVIRQALLIICTSCARS